jgi:hypothetical protein
LVLKQVLLLFIAQYGGKIKGVFRNFQGIGIYFPKAEICQNIEEFLTQRRSKEGIKRCFMHTLCALFAFVVSLS